MILDANEHSIAFFPFISMWRHVFLLKIHALMVVLSTW